MSIPRQSRPRSSCPSGGHVRLSFLPKRNRKRSSEREESLNPINKQSTIIRGAKGAQFWGPFAPRLNSANSKKPFEMYGGDDGARTRDLCRDSEKEGRNLQKTSVTMASFGAVRNDREPLSNPYQTHDLCPVNLCPALVLLAISLRPLPLFGRGHGSV
jgi:hypothetical protein